MTNGVYYDFSSKSSIYQDTAGLFPVVGQGNYVGYVQDTKGVGTPYDASAPSDMARRTWSGWNFIYPAFENTRLQVTLPDLGSDCSIIIITPTGVSVQQGQTIGAGVYTLPAYPMRVFCIVDRALTAQEQADIFLAYGTRYAINYDATIAARTLSGTTYHTDADLGWTPNTDVGASGEIQALINLLANGDTVVFDAMYKISGNYDLSTLSNITFRAATKQACGLNCLDGILELATANGLSLDNQPVFSVGDGFLVDGFYGTQDAVDTMQPGFYGGGGKIGWFSSTSKTGFYAVDCKFDTKGWMFARLVGTSSPIIARNRLVDGKYCIYMTGAVDDAIIAHNYFTGGYTAPYLGGAGTNDFYDGIKTLDQSGRGPERIIFVENDGIDIVRDAIDTTGGLKDAIIDANDFCETGASVIDLKSAYLTSADVALGPLGNTGVSMQYNLIDLGTIVLTTTWEAPDTPDPDFAAGPISTYRNIFRTDRFGLNAVLNKDAKGVVSNQDTFIGNFDGHYESARDDYTPSLYQQSVFTDKVLVP